MPTPPLSLDIDTSEVNSFVVKFPVSGAKIAERELDIALDDALTFAQLQAIDFALDVTNTGKFRSSIYTENQGVKVDLFRGIDLEGIVSSNDFEPKVNAIEFGRLPGKMPPIEKILLWVRERKLAGVFSVKTQRRLGSKAKKEKQDIAVAWGVARHIAKHGTKAQHVFERAFEESKDYIVKTFDDSIDRIITHWSRIE